MYSNKKCSVKNRTINNPVLLDFMKVYLHFLTSTVIDNSIIFIFNTFSAKLGNGRFGGVNETMHACPLVILSYQQSTPIAEYIH